MILKIISKVKISVDTGQEVNFARDFCIIRGKLGRCNDPNFNAEEIFMKCESLQKFGGVSVIAGALLLAAYSILFMLILPVSEVRRDITIAVMNPAWVWIALTAFAGVVFIIFGLITVYSRISASSGLLGLTGFVVVEFAYMLQACKVTWEIFIYPVISANQSFAPLLRDSIFQHSPQVVMFRTAASAAIFIGITLFCLALVRSDRFPKAGGILIFAGALLYGFGPMLSVIAAISGILIHAAGFFILGLKLIRNDANVIAAEM